ncbi:MAG: mannose-1-phosphate guanylyltransferase [Thermodesulfobacteriota bacterium]|nr:mannose-1-phosphate guanylyltransferase [Thermodesulfobacteriota bacterium]
MFAVIMAGGSGTRFWPVSRKYKPKQFLDITGRGPMVVETCARLIGIARDEEILVVLGQEHLDHAKVLFNGRGVHLLAEPVGRNTAPCIALGAVYARHSGWEGSVAFLPADHFVGKLSAFVKALRAAEEQANAGGIVTLGIIPNRPETGYGYIRRDQDYVELDDLKAYKVAEFVEKPGLDDARRFMNSGEYFWNAGIFVATPATILEETATHLPDVYRGLMRLQKALGTDRFDTEFREVYGHLSAISFDYGIMEKTQEAIYVIPCECGWSDVGSWASLYELKAMDCDGDQNLAEGEAILIDCAQSLISSRGSRLVTCLGLKNCLVVDTNDALLVANMDRSQDVKRIVAQLKESGKEDLL